MDTHPNLALTEVAQAFVRMEKPISAYLAEACKTLDHEEFQLQIIAQSHELSTISEFVEITEDKGRVINAACFYGARDPEAYLKNTVGSEESWAEVEAIFRQSIDKARSSDPPSEPNPMERNMVDNLCAYSLRYCVLITDLLLELVELKLFDLQMHAVLRRRWTYVDLILDKWFQEERTVKCGVPRW